MQMPLCKAHAQLHNPKIVHTQPQSQHPGKKNGRANDTHTPTFKMNTKHTFSFLPTPMTASKAWETRPKCHAPTHVSKERAGLSAQSSAGQPWIPVCHGQCRAKAMAVTPLYKKEEKMMAVLADQHLLYHSLFLCLLLSVVLVLCPSAQGCSHCN